MTRVARLITQFLESKDMFLDFAYRYMASRVSENCVISPVHAQILLCLIVFAGDGEAIQELKSNLGIRRGSLERLKNSVRAALTALGTRFEGCGTTTTNAIYVNNKYPIDRHFSMLALNFFDCLASSVSFTEFPAIQRVIKAHCPMGESTKIIMDNEMFFNAFWTTDFRVLGKLGFHGARGPPAVPVLSIHSRSHFNYTDSKYFSAELIQIKLTGENTFIVIILPHSINGLSAVESKIDQIFKFNNYQNRLIDLHMPMFRADGKLDFTDLFKELGVEMIFTEGSADLNLITSQEKNDLFINEFFQMNIFRCSDVSVNSDRIPISPTEDKGLESILGAVPEQAISSASVVVNHPFAFFIKFNDIILYAGRILEHKLIPLEEDSD